MQRQRWSSESSKGDSCSVVRLYLMTKRDAFSGNSDTAVEKKVWRRMKISVWNWVVMVA